MYAPDPEGEFENAQQRVLDDFWVSFFDFSSCIRLRLNQKQCYSMLPIHSKEKIISLLQYSKYL
jgi:hypothetical protein